MKITKEIKKFKLDVVKAISFMFFVDIPRSLFINIASTPSRGVISRDDNNIYKKKDISTSISYGIAIYQTIF